MQKHFVTFYSPGTFMNETSRKEVDSWDVEKAVEMAHSITERYNATPYAFRFSTVDKTGSDWDMQTEDVARGPLYFLGGTVRTYKEVCEQDDPDENILRSNMKSNDYKRVITNTNSWETTVPFGDEDILLDFTPQASQVKSET